MEETLIFCGGPKGICGRDGIRVYMCRKLWILVQTIMGLFTYILPRISGRSDIRPVDTIINNNDYYYVFLESLL